MSAITKYLPKRLVSHWVGCLMYWQGPKWWARWSILNFAKFYKINLDEAEKPYYEYPSIGDFFIRKLKAGARPIAAAAVLHPADSRMTQCEAIADGQMIQAKGLHYSVAEFSQDPKALEKWGQGLFVTYYLCPTDYHRVHSPVSGQITSIRAIPGELWPVNEWSTSTIQNLFCVNERIVVEIQTEWGPVAVVFVGATNVGHIVLSFDNQVYGHRQGDSAFKLIEKQYKDLFVRAGDELGMFRMGSTVVMLYPELFKQNFAGRLDKGPQIRVNSAFVK